MRAFWVRGAVVLAACLVASGSAGYAVYHELESNQESRHEERIRLILSALDDDMRWELGHVSHTLEFAVHQVETHFPNGLHGADENFNRDLLSLIKATRIFGQIRLLDTSGQELIRVQFNAGQPRLVPEAELQNKSDRYYYREGLLLQRGEVYVSPFDLNVEHGEVERPAKPTIRLVEATYDEGGRRMGFVVVNIRGHALLDRVAAASELMPDSELSLINDNGYWLAGPNSADLWAFMYPGREARSLAKQFPDVWSQIHDAVEARVRADGGTYLSTTVRAGELLGFGRRTGKHSGPAWKLVAFHPDAALEAQLVGERRFAVIASGAVGVALAALILVGLRLRTQSRLRRAAEARTRELALKNQKTQAIVTIAGGVGHEFNNILAAILGFAHVLHRDLADKPLARERLEGIESAGQRAAGLVKHLMTFAQVDVSQKQALRLNELVASRSEELRATLPTGVAFEVDITDEPIGLRSDPKKLEAMLTHLISNAVDAVAGREDPRIRLELDICSPDPEQGEDDDRPRACLSVVDNGCGISADDLPYIFDPFFTTKEVGQGTGLGLSHVYGVVLALHGEVSADSREGEGTTIQILLPIENTETAGADSSA